jgi:hypothetical protein
MNQFTIGNLIAMAAAKRHGAVRLSPRLLGEAVRRAREEEWR